MIWSIFGLLAAFGLLAFIIMQALDWWSRIAEHFGFDAIEWLCKPIYALLILAGLVQIVVVIVV